MLVTDSSTCTRAQLNRAATRPQEKNTGATPGGRACSGQAAILTMWRDPH